MNKYTSPLQLTRRIDPSLIFVDVLCPSSCLVYLVEKDQERRVLKTVGESTPFTKNIDEMAKEQLIEEEKVLQKLKDFPGITHLVRTYYSDTGELIALLKEYAPGKPLFTYPHTLEDYKTIKETIKSVHLKGVANLDIQSNNIIKSGINQPPVLVDIGIGFLEEELSPDDFKDLIRRDYLHLDIIYGKSEN